MVCAYDLITSTGIRIEVKSSAYLQSWSQKRLSTISFSISPARYWDRNGKKKTNMKKEILLYLEIFYTISYNRFRFSTCFKFPLQSIILSATPLLPHLFLSLFYLYLLKLLLSSDNVLFHHMIVFYLFYPLTISMMVDNHLYRNSIKIDIYTQSNNLMLKIY
jgi:hypothetical protein